MDAAAHIAEALALLGLTQDPEVDATGISFADMLAEFTPSPVPTIVPLASTSHEIVALHELPFHSLCAHHLVPFFGTCSIAYRPLGRIAGLGDFPRVLTALARRPQLQERLAAQVADTLFAALGPQALGVRIVARQMCMEMRGARSAGTVEVVAWRGEDDEQLSRLLRA